MDDKPTETHRLALAAFGAFERLKDEHACGEEDGEEQCEDYNPETFHPALTDCQKGSTEDDPPLDCNMSEPGALTKRWRGIN